MSKDPLDRPATPEEIEMVERLLKRTPECGAPKARPVRKSSTEVLACDAGVPVAALERKLEEAGR